MAHLEPIPDDLLRAEVASECPGQLERYRTYAFSHLDFCLGYKINWDYIKEHRIRD